MLSLFCFFWWVDQYLGREVLGPRRRQRVRSVQVNWRLRTVAATSRLGGAIGDAFALALGAPSNVSPIAGTAFVAIWSLVSFDTIEPYFFTLISRG